MSLMRRPIRTLGILLAVTTAQLGNACGGGSTSGSGGSGATSSGGTSTGGSGGSTTGGAATGGSATGGSATGGAATGGTGGLQCGGCIQLCEGGQCSCSCPTSCAGYARPTLQKSCKSDADCFAGVHTADCCGSLVVLGYNTAAKVAFATYESDCTKRATCACAPLPATLENGQATPDVNQRVALCITGQCYGSGPVNTGSP